MKRTAFTLIELLVVIAIIALLAAILFPVFATAREKARQTTCASNEKQIGLAMIQYANDFDEVYPCRSNIVSATMSWTSQILPYVKSHGIYQCPDDTVARAYSSDYVSYAMPDNLLGGSWAYHSNSVVLTSGMAGCYQRGHTAGEIPAPATTLMIVEYFSAYNAYNTGYGGDLVGMPSSNVPCSATSATDIANNLGGQVWQDAYTKGIAMHSGGWNYAFVDGHVKWMKPWQTVGQTPASFPGGPCLAYGRVDSAGMWTLDPND